MPKYQSSITACLSALLIWLPLASAANDRLDHLRIAFDEAMETQVISKYKKASADLDTKYAAALEVAIVSTSQAGRLDDALALRADKERLSKNEPMPDADEATAPTVLKEMRQKYRDSKAKLESATAIATTPVIKRYDDSLAALETEYTKAGNLTEASAVRAERDYLKTKNSNAAGTPIAKVGGQPNEVSRDGLKNRNFIWGEFKDGSFQPFNTLFLNARGKIENATHPNESTWKIDADGHLNFLAADDNITTVFETPKWLTGAVGFRGKFIPSGASMFLEETTRINPTPGFLSEIRLTRSNFELATLKPRQGEHQMLRLKPGGVIEGARFDAAPKWSVNAQGCLVFTLSSGKKQIEFTEPSTWDSGKMLYLTEKSTKAREVAYRLIEHP